MYVDGGLAMIPQKIVMWLIFDNEWVIRNEVVCECKVADPAPENRLKRSHETAFHLATGMGYYYDRTMGAAKKQGPAWKNGTLAWKNGIPSSRTGVVGRKYAKYINESTDLSDEERQAARSAMMETFGQLNSGEISDYRVAIRGIHKVDGARAKEVAAKGFSISKTRTHSLPVSDLWRDARGSSSKPIPKELVSMMVRLTCRPGGVVLDLFPAEETARVVLSLGRRYVAVSSDEALLARMEAALSAGNTEGNLFDEEKDDECQNPCESQTRVEDQCLPSAQEAVQEAQGEA
jgi:hypothetical protein